MLTITGITGCGSARKDKRLVQVSNQIADSLSRAEDLLKEIDRNHLSASDRHFYDFLSLKIDDKNYVRHTSDSLYLSIKDYYSNHADEDFYPEVLYYGGRVYSDLGDYPTALKYFQDALDALPEDTDNIDLKACILSQTGRLLNQLRLYSEAEGYIERVVEIDKSGKNLEDLVYDLQLLGAIDLNLNNFYKAKENLQAALNYSKTLPSSFTAKVQMYLARTESKMGNHEEAMILIRQTPDKVKPISRDWAIAYAAEIYYAAGVYDTAYLYARNIIDNPRSFKKKTGYKILLTPELMKFIPKDSLVYYVSQYNNFVEEYLNRNEVSQISVQLSSYNYQKKESKIEEISSSRSRLIFWGTTFILILVVMLVVSYILRVNNKRHLNEFEIAINKINSLYREEIQAEDTVVATTIRVSEPEIDEDQITPSFKDSDNLDKKEEENKRSKLKKSLLNSATNNPSPTPDLPLELISSEAYVRLQEYVRNQRPLPDDSPLWVDIEKETLNHYPHFRYNLSVLMKGKETVQDVRTCLLIKLQLSSTSISKLLAISPGGLVSRRDSISIKIFGSKLGAKKTDYIIRSL